MKERRQWSVASISAQETQPEVSSPIDRGGKALHVLLQVVLPIREGKSELLLPFSIIH
jgi:hypothetical protein